MKRRRPASDQARCAATRTSDLERPVTLPLDQGDRLDRHDMTSDIESGVNPNQCNAIIKSSFLYLSSFIETQNKSKVCYLTANEAINPDIS